MVTGLIGLIILLSYTVFQVINKIRHPHSGSLICLIMNIRQHKPCYQYLQPNLRKKQDETFSENEYRTTVWIASYMEKRSFCMKTTGTNVAKSASYLRIPLSERDLGCLPFTQTTQMEIFGINTKWFCLSWQKTDNMQNVWTSAVNPKMSNKNASLWSEAHKLRSTPNGMMHTIWFSNGNFRVFHVYGKHPLSPVKIPTEQKIILEANFKGTQSKRVGWVY